MIKRWLWWIPGPAWAALIFWASSRPIGSTPSWWFDGADKVIHAILFGTLAGLLFVPLRIAHGWRAEKAALLAFLLAVGYGVSDEFHQRTTAGRVSDPYDAAADATGAALAVATCILAARTAEALAARRKGPVST